MGEQPEIFELLISLGLMGVECLTLIFFLVMAILTFQLFRKTWRRGLVMALVVLGLALPSTVLSMAYLDVGQVARTIPPEMLPVVRVVIGIVAVVMLLALVPVRMAYFHVGAVEWERVRPEGGIAGPAATRRKGMWIGAATGVAATLVTMGVFHALQVREGNSVAQFEKLFPGMNDEISLGWVLTMLGFVVSAAVVEEYIFRGGILGFLLRVGGNSTVKAWVFITVVAFVWALLHLLNTDHPLVKFVQIFLLGLAFGGMARRWGIGASVSGHVALNASAVVYAVAFPGMQ